MSEGCNESHVGDVHQMMGRVISPEKVNRRLADGVIRLWSMKAGIKVQGIVERLISKKEPNVD